MKQRCKYAIVQFLPYAETDEFANVGVLVCAPKTGFLDFKMANPRFARVTDFFEDLDGAIYKAAINAYADELKQIKQIGADFRGKNLLNFVVEVTRYRGSLLRFGNLRTIACDNPQNILEELYSRYVARDFLSKEYREQAMVKAIRGQLNASNLAIKYHQKKVSSDLCEVNLPLVAEVDEKLRVIKPLAFNQLKTTRLIEHGEAWINRFKWLIKDNKVMAGSILLPVEGPKSKGKLDRAYNEVIHEIKALDVNVIDFDDKQRLVNFASEEIIPAAFQLRH